MTPELEALCGDSTVRRNLLTRPGYSPYCGSKQCSCHWPRAQYDVNRQQFLCDCGWVSEFPADFQAAYTHFRIGNQVCRKCGVTVANNKQKYCGDGSDKDNPHQWQQPGSLYLSETSLTSTKALMSLLGSVLI